MMRFLYHPMIAVPLNGRLFFGAVTGASFAQLAPRDMQRVAREPHYCTGRLQLELQPNRHLGRFFPAFQYFARGCAAGVGEIPRTMVAVQCARRVHAAALTHPRAGLASPCCRPRR